RFGRCRFGRCRFGRCRFGRCRFGRCRFGRCRFGRCRFGRCRFTRTGFGRSQLGHREFSGRRRRSAWRCRGNVRGGRGDLVARDSRRPRLDRRSFQRLVGRLLEVEFRERGFWPRRLLGRQRLNFRRELLGRRGNHLRRRRLPCRRIVGLHRLGLTRKGVNMGDVRRRFLRRIRSGRLRGLSPRRRVDATAQEFGRPLQDLA
ncbi:MAG: pentapeptide repeat-containing protein, partial [Pirellulaceae bacterium]